MLGCVTAARRRIPEIIKYLEAENAYTDAHMDQHKAFVDALYKEMLGQDQADRLSVPMKNGGHWYFNKTEEGKQYATYFRSKTRDGKDAELLMDQNEMAKGFKYFADRRVRAER